MTEPLLPLADRIEANADTVERELLKLVLTIVELVRQLMERQAIRQLLQDAFEGRRPSA